MAKPVLPEVSLSGFLRGSGFRRPLPACFPNWAESLALRGQPRKGSKLGTAANQRCCFPESPERAAHRPRRGNSTGTKAQALD